jgi:NADH-quinone oxidoreductase subunit J
MVLAHRERATPKPTQRELARRRMASGSPAPLPGPGTYARHNAVDMPALLPDGSPSQLSVSPVISRAEPGRRELGGAAPGGSSPAGGRPGDHDPDDQQAAQPSEAGAGRPRGEARW